MDIYIRQFLIFRGQRSKFYCLNMAKMQDVNNSDLKDTDKTSLNDYLCIIILNPSFQNSCSRITKTCLHIQVCKNGLNWSYHGGNSTFVEKNHFIIKPLRTISYSVFVAFTSACFCVVPPVRFFIRPKLKNTLFALYRPYIFGQGRSVGKMFYFFKHYPSKRQIRQNNLFVHVCNINYIYLFNIPLFQHVTLTSKYIHRMYIAW